jgi:hypothetical protein
MTAFAKGQWVAQTDCPRPTFGVILEKWEDDGEFLMNVALYSPEGAKIGRLSPALGGPKSFEPAVPCKCYHTICEPTFPLKLDSYGDWKAALKTDKNVTNLTSSKQFLDAREALRDFVHANEYFLNVDGKAMYPEDFKSGQIVNILDVSGKHFEFTIP